MPGFLGVSHGPWVVPPPPSSVGDVLVVTASGIYVYDLADDTWTTITPSPDPGGFPLYTSAAASGDNFWTIHGPGGDGLRHSQDGGGIWAAVPFPGDGDGTGEYLSLYNELLYMGYFGDSTAADGVYSRPMDGTGSWSLAYDGSPETTFHVVDVSNSDRFWFGKTIAGPARRFAYVDGGSETVITGISPANPSVLGVATIPDNEPLAYGWSSFEGAFGVHAYKFNDNSFTDITPAAITPAAFADNISGIDAKDASTIVLNYYDSVADTIRLYRSTNGGTSWTQVATYAALSSGPYSTVVWSRLTPDLVVASLRTRIAFSADGGATWTESSVAPTPQIAGLAVLT